MPRDINLKLADSGTPITSTTALTAVDTEGGFYALVVMDMGVITDSDETFNITVEASGDNGSNYFHIGEFPQIANGDESTKISRPVYVPKPDSGQTKTKVRLKARAVGGTTPSLPVDAWLEPMVSLSPPAIDEVLGQGVATLT